MPTPSELEALLYIIAALLLVAGIAAREMERERRGR
jgi:hypothetical protein